MWDRLFTAVDGLGRGINASWLRNEVITNNIANADTPGFKVSKVRFEDVLASTISSGGVGAEKSPAAAFTSVKPTIVRDDNTSYRGDGNNVDIEAQMTALAQNSLQYYTLISKINSEFRRIRMAISGNG